MYLTEYFRCQNLKTTNKLRQDVAVKPAAKGTTSSVFFLHRVLLCCALVSSYLLHCSVFRFSVVLSSVLLRCAVRCSLFFCCVVFFSNELSCVVLCRVVRQRHGKVKGKDSLLQAVEARRVARG
jgi:hypothetical protein